MQDRPSDTPLQDGQRGRRPDLPGDALAGGGRLMVSGLSAGRFSTKKVAVGLLVLLAAALALKAAAGWVLHGRFMVETDDAYVEADTALISPETTGLVAEVAVTENARVQAGDVLVRLIDADARARLAQADSAVVTARAALANAEARLTWQGSMIRAADATVATARSDITRTQADHERYTRLHERQITTAQRWEQARNEAEKARAALQRADAGLEAEHQQLPVLQTQIDQARAQITQGQAQLELARIELARTVIRAPVAGIVGNRGVQVGQYVRPGTQLLAIVPIPLVRVVANFKETQIAWLRRGQEVSIHADAWPDVTITGHVESLAPASGSRFSLLPPDNATGNFTKIVQRVPVRIAIDPANALAGRLRPGLSVIVAIDRRAVGEGEQSDRLLPMSSGTISPRPVSQGPALVPVSPAAPGRPASGP